MLTAAPSWIKEECAASHQVRSDLSLPGYPYIGKPKKWRNPHPLAEYAIFSFRYAYNYPLRTDAGNHFDHLVVNSGNQFIRIKLMFYHDNNRYINFLLIVPASKVSPAHSRRARRYKQYVPGKPCSLSPELFPIIP